MLLVKTRIGQSKIHGIGLFADQFIPKDTIIWKFYPKYDLAFKKKDLGFLPKAVLESIIDYCYRSGDDYVLCFDNARFFNHSDNPNTVDQADMEAHVLAGRDIQLGEELTTDYRVFDHDHQLKLG